jgi:two-component system cell cycle sensor histidine kinase/response regulator CckA
MLHDRVLGGEAVRGMELVRHAKDGKPVEIALTAIPLRDNRGEIRGTVEWIVDITAEKRMRQGLERTQQMATLGRLAGGIVHDFNNLITVVASHNAMILQALDEESPLRERTTEIDRACQRAEGLARQLLNVSRGKTPQIAPMAPNAVVREVEGMLERLTRDIKWEIRLDPEGPLVEADCGQIHQALLNLVLNACEAMPDGGTLTIETATVHIDEKPGRYTLLAVSDTGVGFDETVKNRLFEQFFTTKENGAVGGLGLATVHRVVTEAGGWIQVHSQPKKGTRFEIYLPQMDNACQAMVN